MSYDAEFSYGRVVVQAEASERAAFIRRTYAHLAGAILAFVALEALVFGFLREAVGLDSIMRQWFTSIWLQLGVIAAFVGSSYLARYWAMNGGSAGVQYLGL